MTSEFDTSLLSRIEDAGINASAPREQLWVDGWLVRFSRGKAKRARCIQAVAAGRMSVEGKLERCLALYAKVGLRPYVRVTPFSQPGGLDARLATLGMERIDDTRVMVAALESDSAAIAAQRDVPGVRLESCDSDSFAEWVGAQRGSSEAERDAHAERLHASPVDYRASQLIDSSGKPVAGGQVAIEDDLVGLYDVFTAESARGRGLARTLCAQMLRRAAQEGARTAYLQVEASNDAARRVYRGLGFADAYAYHYRSPPVA
jgi:ribosomal protein S18 acetylase RimI-like enzyme